MPCDTRRQPEQTIEERGRQIDAALAGLERQLQTGGIKVAIDRVTGAVAFGGWSEQDRAGVTDVCAYRVLAARNSWALRQAVARAEQLTGRKVNAQAVAAGVHSHDGGNTWGPGH